MDYRKKGRIEKQPPKEQPPVQDEVNPMELHHLEFQIKELQQRIEGLQEVIATARSTNRLLQTENDQLQQTISQLEQNRVQEIENAWDAGEAYGSVATSNHYNELFPDHQIPLPPNKEQYLSQFNSREDKQWPSVDTSSNTNQLHLP